MDQIMIWTAMIVAAAVALGATLYVVWPMIKSGPAPVVIEDDRLTELLGRKDTVMVAIKDLEFDYQVGKVSAEDYELFDRRLRQQAIGLLKQIEQLTPQSEQLDNRLESEITKLRKTSDRAPQPSSNGQRPAAASGAAAQNRFCTNCGEAVAANHKFCANCGQPIGEQALAVES